MNEALKSDGPLRSDLPICTRPLLIGRRHGHGRPRDAASGHAEVLRPEWVRFWIDAGRPYLSDWHSTDDPQFASKFEKPYRELGIPLFAILGEHDWGRKEKMCNRQAQIDDTKHSSLWPMPSDVCLVTLGVLQILALNTNALPGSEEQIA
jgi:hypothetical protein